ncbi:MAG TPA: DUF6492 family protein [Chlamydiales bacterium]|nr:DUF6492 family protein [Chlamydiales bacterium]
MLKLLCWLLVAMAPLWGDIVKRKVVFSTEPIDVVIPCAPKDRRSLELCIKGIRENGKNLRRIIVVSKERLTDSAEWFSEDAFPFTKEDLALEIFRGDGPAASEFIHRPETRIGWIFQQFLKFYSPFVIPDISPNVLILDADVIFLNKVQFMTNEGNPCFAPSDEPMHAPYFSHAARLVKGLHRVHPRHSGIAHHMLFQKPLLEDLFALIAQEHGTEPWRAICRATDLNDVGFGGFSEYEIYFNFALLRTDQANIRPLRWIYIHSLRIIPGFKQAGYSYVCFPTWLTP